VIVSKFDGILSALKFEHGFNVIYIGNRAKMLEEDLIFDIDEIVINEDEFLLLGCIDFPRLDFVFV
jgi:hypothetical protein